MTRQLITDNHTLRARYQGLGPGDLVLGRFSMKPGEETMLVDLLERGILLFPSALSQLACRSKTLQARIFAPWMLPWTRVICDQNDLLESINLYNREGLTRVVTKHDRRNAGMGIHLWPSVEEVYTHTSFNSLPYPFVLQPFQPDCRDLRVIILGDYLEAYERHNPHNFRHNLHCGGASRPCPPTETQLELCREVMARGRFPYAHLDLMIGAAGDCYLAEINLRGGIRGARITPDAYRQQVEKIHRARAQSWREGRS